MTIKVRDFESKDALLAQVESLIRSTLTQEADHDYALMVSGGNTPLPVYAAIASDPVVAAPRAHLAFTDDRYVPVDSPESNFGNARAMIEAVGLSERCFRIDPTLDIEACAAHYDADLSEFLARGGRIPVALLGLGSDGHTCSLFSDTDLVRAENCLAVPAYKETPPDRITVTPSLLAEVGEIIFVVAGTDKATMIDALINNPESITAGKAISGCASVSIWRA
jgi:6-phosphogluconolactonase